MRRIRKGLSESRGGSVYGRRNPRKLYEEAAYDNFMGTVEGQKFSNLKQILGQGINIENGGFEFDNCSLRGVNFSAYRGKKLVFISADTEYTKCDFSKKIISLYSVDGINRFKNCNFNDSTFISESYFFDTTFDLCSFADVNFKGGKLIFDKCDFHYPSMDDISFFMDGIYRTDVKRYFSKCTINGEDFASVVGK